MTVTLSQPTKFSVHHWEITFTSDLTSPTFYVYNQGKRVVVTVGLRALIRSELEPHVEVYDVEATVPDQYTNPGRITLQWYHLDGAHRYRVEQLIDGVWTEKSIVNAQGDRYYSWVSDWLDDAIGYTFRVVPIDSLGNVGTPV